MWTAEWPFTEFFGELCCILTQPGRKLPGARLRPGHTTLSCLFHQIESESNPCQHDKSHGKENKDGEKFAHEINLKRDDHGQNSPKPFRRQ
jgi:hypothetical protein